MLVKSSTSLKELTNELIDDVLAKENFSGTDSRKLSVKSGFLTGGNIIVCESKGLQEYIQKACVDRHGIWTCLPFKPLAGLLMQCAFILSKDKKDEKENIFNPSNMVWAIYKLLKDNEKTYYYANELSNLFFAYQIYRPHLIENWNNNKPYSISHNFTDDNFINNEKIQRKLWNDLKNESKNEQDISQLYKILESELKKNANEVKHLPKQIFIFAPLSVTPVHLSALTCLTESDSKVILYLYQISKEYTGGNLSEKKKASLRKKAWENNKIIDDEKLYWDIGCSLIANLGRSAQILFEQLIEFESEEKLQLTDIEAADIEENLLQSRSTLLSKIQSDIINDVNTNEKCNRDNSITINNCFSPLREIEVLRDYIFELFINNKDLTPADVAVVSPNIEKYSSVINTVFNRDNILNDENNVIPFKIADRDFGKYDKTTQLLNMLFSIISSRYEAPDITALYEYSMYVQDTELSSDEIERLENWIAQNAMRFSLDSSDQMPNYSFEKGLMQLAAGFFTLSENGFSETGDYCYPDIEGSQAILLGDFWFFIKALRRFDNECKTEKSIEDWDVFFKDIMLVFFGNDEIDFNEENDNPYQKVMSSWDSLKKEMLIGFNFNNSTVIDFSVIKTALPKMMDSGGYSSFSMDGKISFSNIETVRAIPYKVICCIGMNVGEFPHQIINKEISLMPDYMLGDKDTPNEERLMFLELILSAKEKLYISWIGQSEKDMEEIEPSSAITMLINYIKEQYLHDDDIIVKHPLQPFSKKYKSNELITYDDRWAANDSNINSKYNTRDAQSFNNLNIWKWEISNSEIEDKKNMKSLYYILSRTPEYFIKNICDIELPEDTNALENTEPFSLEDKLAEYVLENMVLDNENYDELIKIKKYRGELPDGKFADQILKNEIEIVNELKKEKENLETKSPDKKIFIKACKDKGKHRLWQWLLHLYCNIENENTSTITIFMDEKKEPLKIYLKGLSKENANKEINDLYALTEKLKNKMQPIFPNAAWEYMSNTADYNDAHNEELLAGAWGKIEIYSQYDNMAIGEAGSFDDLGIDLNITDQFIECSKQLFKTYITQVII